MLDLSNDELANALNRINMQNFTLSSGTEAMQGIARGLRAFSSTRSALHEMHLTTEALHAEWTKKLEEASHEQRAHVLAILSSLAQQRAGLHKALTTITHTEDMILSIATELTGVTFPVEAAE